MNDWEIKCDTRRRAIGGWIIELFLTTWANDTDTHVPASFERFTRLVDERISIMEKNVQSDTQLLTPRCKKSAGYHSKNESMTSVDIGWTTIFSDTNAMIQ